MPAALRPDSCSAMPATHRADAPLADRAVCTYESTVGLKDDEKVDAYLQLSNDFQHEGRLPETLAVLQAVVSKKTDDAAAWYRLGLTYLRMERASEACLAFVRAQRLGNHSFQCHCGLAEALMELGRRAEAAVHLSIAVELDPSAHEAYCRLGICLGQLGRPDDSVAALKRAIALAPDRTDYHRRLAFAYDNMGNRDEAVRCFNLAVDLERKWARTTGGGSAMRSCKSRQKLYPSSFLPARPRTGPAARLGDLFRDRAGYILVGAIALTAWLFLHIYDRGICR